MGEPRQSARLTIQTAGLGSEADRPNCRGKWRAKMGRSGPEDDVAIDLDGDYTVTLDLDATLRRPIMGGASGAQTLSVNGRTLTLAADSFLRPNALLRLSSGTFAAGPPWWSLSTAILSSVWNGGRASRDPNEHDLSGRCDEMKVRVAPWDIKEQKQAVGW